MKKLPFLLILAACRLFALPSGEEVKAGSAEFCSDSKGLSIATSDKAIIEYQQFNIDKGESVRFIQPSSKSCVLNRVVGGDESQILGQLSGNGRIFLVNPNGIYFGPDAVVNAGSFLAASLSIRDEDFMADRFEFCLDPGAAGSIVNEGTIQADGFVALFAPIVENRGSCIAHAEKVFIGAAEKVAIDLMGDGLIQFRVDGELEKALIENYGKIEAAYGDVQISLRTALRAIQSVLNTDGIEVAAAIEEVDGCIRLLGTSEIAARNVEIEGGRVDVSGKIDAPGGGSVHILGDHLSLIGAAIDVSGAMGGGEVLIGGDYQGLGPHRNAIRTTVDEKSVIYANAIERGDGGNVIFWADDTTLFDGQVFACGGKLGGDGGFIETSGKNDLMVLDRAFVSTAAPLGKYGNWLLDPPSVIVETSGTGSLPIASCTTGGAFTITPTTIAAATSNVTLCAQNTTTSTVTVSNAVTMTHSGVTLTLTAGSTSVGTITLNAGLTTVGGSISLNGVVALGAAITLDTTNAGGTAAGANISFSNTLNGAETLTCKGGSSGVVTFTGAVGATTALTSLTATGATITQSSSAKTTGALSYTGTSAINVEGGVATSGGIITMTGPVAITNSPTIDSTNAGATAAGANINFSSTINGANALTLRAGTGGNVIFSGAVGNSAPPTNIAFTSAALIQIGANITVSGANTLTFPSAVSVIGTSTITSNSANVGFSSTLNGAQALTVTGGTGTVTFTGAVGATTALSSLSAAGATITQSSTAAATTGGISYSGTSAINLNGNLTTSAGAVGLTGPVTLNGNIAIDTTNAGGSASGAGITASSNISQASTQTLTLNSGTGGAVSIGGNLTANVFTLTNSGGTTITGTTIVPSLTLTNTTGTIAFGGAVTVGTAFTTAAQGYNVAFNNGGTITPAAAFANTGTVTLQSGGSTNLALTNGVAHTVGPTVILGKIVTTAAATSMSFGATTFNSGSSTLLTPGGTVSFAATTLNGNASIDTTNANANPLGASVSFSSTVNGASNLTVNAGTGGTATFTGAVGGTTALSTLTATGATITQSSTAKTAAGGVSYTGSSSINLNGNLTTALGAVSLSGPVVLGAAITIDTTNGGLSGAGNAISFSNTVNGAFAFVCTGGTSGAVTFTGAVGAGVGTALTTLTATGAAITQTSTATATTGGISYSGTSAINLAGNLTTSGSAVGLTGPVTLNGNIAIDTTNAGGSATGAGISASSNIAQASTQTLTLNSGTGGAISIGGNLAVNAFTVTNSGGTAITGTTTAPTVTLTNTTGALIFNGAATIATALTTAAQSYSIVFNNGGTITPATTFINTGGLTLKNGSSASLGFTNGATYTAGSSVILGTIKTTAAAAPLSFGTTTFNAGTSSLLTPGGAVAIGTTTLSGNTSIDTTNGGGTLAGAAIGFTGPIDGANNLTLTAGTGGNISFSSAVGSATPLNTLTFASANNVTAAALSAASIAQTTGSGTTSFNGAVNTTGSSGIVLTGAAFALTAAITTTNAGPLTISHSGLLAFSSGITYTINGPFSESGAGTTNLAGTINTSNQNITFGAATTVTGTAALSSGGGTITFSNTLAGTAQTLNLTAGAGNIVFTGTVSGTNALTIASAVNVTANALSAASIVQSAGTGTTTFNGAVNTSGASGIALTGSAFMINADIATSTGGSLSIAHSGLLTFASGLTHTINGSFSGSGTGTTSLAGEIDTNAQNISFGTAVTLSNTATLNTSSGIGDIIFSSTLNGGFNLNLTAGAGNVTFTGAVGGSSALATATINSANNVTANGLILSVFNQIAGTGTTTFNGAVSTSNVLGLSVTTRNATFNNTVMTSSGGPAAVSVGGTLALNSAATFSLSGPFTQSGAGVVQMANSIAATSGAITFGSAVTLTGPVSLTTSVGGGNIVFSSTLDGSSALTLAAGGGAISIAGAVGSTTRLGALTINSAASVTTAGIKASSINETVSIGSTSITGTIDVNGASGVQLSGGAITLNGSLITASGPFNISNTGTLSLTAGGSTLLGGNFAQSGGGGVDLSGTLIGNNTSISFANNIMLEGTASINSGPGAGTITLSGTVDGGSTLSLSSGTANTTISGAIGGGILLTSVTFATANNITVAAISAGSILQLGGSGATTFNGAVTTTGSSGIVLTGTAFAINGAVTTSMAGPLTISHSGALTFAAGLTHMINGTFAESGGGTVSLAGTIDTADQNLSFGSPTMLAGTASLNSSGGAISFSSTLDGLQNLTLAAGGGNIVFTGAVGGSTPLNTLTIASGNNVTANAVSAAAFVQSAGSGTTTFNGALNSSGSSGISLSGSIFTFASSAAAAGSGTFAIVNSGLLTLMTGVTLSSGGAFTQSGAGNLSLVGTISTNGANLTLGTMAGPNGAIALSGTTALTTGSSSGILTIYQTMDGAQALTVTGATALNLVGILGGSTPLTNLTIQNSNNVTANAITLNGLMETMGTGTTIFNGALLVNTISGITLSGAAFDFNNTVTTTSAGPFTLSNSGTAAIGAAFNIAGAFSQSGSGGVTLGSNITTANGGISFGSAVTLNGASILNSGEGSGNIVFSSTVDGGEALTLSAGSGNVQFSGTIGGTTPLSSLSATGNNIALVNIGGASAGVAGTAGLSATTANTFNGTIYNGHTQNYSAATNLMNAGSLTTFTSSDNPVAFTGTVQLAASTNLTVNTSGGNVSFGSLRAGSNSLRTVTVNAGAGSVTLTSGAGLSGDGEFTSLSLSGGDLLFRGNTFSNAISMSASSINLGGNITVVGTTLTFPAAVTCDTILTPVVTTGGGNLIFSSTVDGAANLTLVAGSGTITASGAIGGMSSLTSLAISSGTGTFGAITAGYITQAAGSSAFNGAINTSNLLGVNLAGANFTFAGTATTSSGGSILVANTGTLTISSALGVNGQFNQSGAGAAALSNNITAANAIAFTGPLTLSGTSVLTSGNAIAFNDTVDGGGNLTMTASAGNVTFLANAGDGSRLGAFLVTNAVNVTTQDVTALSINVTSTGTMLFEGALNTDGSSGVVITGVNYTRHAVTTTNGGPLIVDTTGALNVSGMLSIDGSIEQLGTGPQNLSGNVHSNTGNILYNSQLTLLGATAFSAPMGSIQLATVDGTQTVSMIAGTDITITGAVGAVTPLGDMTITTARNVSFDSSLQAASIIQTTGTATTTFTGAVSTSDSIGMVISTNSIVQGSTITTTGGGPLTFTVSSSFTSPGGILASGPIMESGGGAVNIQGTVATTSAAISFADPITMAADTMFSTGVGPGGISLNSTVQGAYNLTLDALGGNISLGGALGTSLTPITSLTINHAANATAAAITAAALSQLSGTGTTTFGGDLTIGATGIALTGSAFSFNAPYSTTGGLTLSNAGLANFAAAGNITGAVSVTGSGSSQISSSIAAGGSLQILSSALSVVSASSLDTSVGGTLIQVAGTVTGTGSLTLSSGLGDILFTDDIASLGALIISSGADATMQGISCSSIAISGVTDTLTFNDDLATSGSLGVSINGAAITFFGDLTAGGTGSISLVNSGLLMMMDGTVFTSGGSLTQSGSGDVYLTGDLIANGAITLGTMGGPNGAISLLWPTTMNSGGSASIAIYQTIDGNFPLGFTAGSGDVDLNATVGGATPVGALTVVSCNNFNVFDVSALSLSQLAGSGTFSAGTSMIATSLITTGSAGVTIVGTNVFRNGSLTTTNGGSVTVTNSGLLTGQAGSTTTVSGSFILNGTGTLDVAGTVSAGGAVLVTEQGTIFNNVSITSGSGGITLGTIDSYVAGTNSLTLNCGGGPLSLSAIGSTSPIGDISITNASTVATAALSAASFSSSYSSSAVFNGAVATTGSTGIVLNGPSASFQADVSTTGSGPMFITHTGVLSFANAIAVDLSGSFTQTGTGSISLGGSIASSGSIADSGPITLTAPSTLDVSGGSGNISLAQSVDGGYALTLIGGSGTIGVQNIGQTTPLTSFSLEGSGGITFSGNGTIAGPFTISGAGGTTTFNGKYSASGNISLGVAAITLNKTLTTTGTGSISIVNSGAMQLVAGSQPITSATTFTQSGGGSVALGMNIFTTGALQIGSNLTMSAPVTMNSGGGLLSLANVDGANNLTLIAGTGSIQFEDIGDIAPVANLTIQSAANVTGGAVTGTSNSGLTQLAGTGLTHFTGALSLGSVGIILTGNQFTFDAPVATQSGSTGPMTIVHTGLLTINSSALATIDGAFTGSGGGAVMLSANMTINNQSLSFAGPITLGGNVTLNNGAGTGNIVLSSAVTGAGFSLSLSSGLGSTTLNNALSGLSSCTVSGATILQNSTLSASGAVQETGAITLQGGITTSGGNILLTGPVTAAISPLTLTTGAGAGDIHLTNLLNGDTSGRSIAFSAGTGTVTFDAAIGGSVAFHDFTVNAGNIAMANFGSTQPGATGTAAFTASSAIAFNGTSYINGIQNYTAGTTFNFNGGALTTISSSNQNITFATGTIVLSAGNDLTINSNGANITTTALTRYTGDIMMNELNVTLNASTGVVNAGAMGSSNYPLNDVVLTGNTVNYTPGTILAASLTISSVTPITLMADLNTPGLDHIYDVPVYISPTTGSSVTMITGNLTFNSTLDGGASGYNLIITPGGDNVSFNNPVGSSVPLSSITINSAADVTVASTMAVGSFSQTGGTGTTTISAGLTTTGSDGISIGGDNISLNGPFSTGNSGPMTVSNTGTLMINGISASISGAFQAGAATASGNIAADGIEFTGAVDLGGTLTLNSGGDIDFTTVDGGSDLNLTSAGTIAFSDALGNSTRLGQFIVQSGALSTSSLIEAASVAQLGGSGSYQNLDTNAVAGISLAGSAFTIDGTINAANGGPFIITNSGDLSLSSSAAAISGSLTQNGTGTSTVSGMFTVGGQASFATAASIGDTTTIDTSANNNNITFSSALSGPGALTLTSGTGDIDLGGNVSGLGDFSLSGEDITTAAIGANSITTLATGETNISGNLTSTEAASLTGTNYTINGVLTAGGGFTISNSGVLRLTLGSGSLISGGAFTQEGGGSVQIAGTLSTMDQDISFANELSLEGAASLSTSGGDVVFSSTLDGGYALDLSAGSGTIEFGDDVGSLQTLGALTIHSTSGITYPSVSASSIAQLANSGVTTITGPLTSTGTSGISFAGDAIEQNGDISALGTGSFSITHSGLFSMGSSSTTTVTGGSYTETLSSVGDVTLGGLINTTNSPISFLGSGSITLGNNMTFYSGPVGADFTFASTIDALAAGTQTLTLTPLSGSVTFNSAVGGMAPLGNITITQANNVTTQAVSATTINQTAGTGLTDFKGVVTTAGNLALAGNGFTFEQDVEAGTGNVTILNQGTLTIDAASAWSGVGSFSQNGTGPVSLKGSIASSGAIIFTGPVAATGSPTLDSSASNMPISFLSTLDGPGGVTLVSGTGHVTFDFPIGGLSTFGALQITSAGNVNAQAITAASIVQLAGSGTALYQGDLNTSGSTGISIAGSAITFNGDLTTAASSTGPITLDNSGQLTLAAGNAVSSDGAFEQTGAGAVSLGSNVTANNQLILFDGAVTMTSDIVLNPGSGDITLNSPVYGSTSSSQDLTLSSSSTSGTITLNGIGTPTIPIGNLLVSDSYDIDQLGAAMSLGDINALSYNATVRGTINIGQNGNPSNIYTYGASGITVAYVNLNRRGNVIATGGGGLFLTISGVSTGYPGNEINVQGPVTQIGTGATINFGGSITTQNQPMLLQATFDLIANMVLASNGGDITLSGVLNGAGSYSTNISAGNGGVFLDATLGATTQLTSLTVSGSTIQISSIGGASAGVSGATSLTATNLLTFTGTSYNANAQTYAGAVQFDLESGSATTFTSNGQDLMFNNGTIELGAGTNLTLNSGGGGIAVGDVHAGEGSLRTLTLNAGAGDIAAGTIGTAGNAEFTAVSLTGAEITLNGDIISNTVTLAPTGTLFAGGDITTANTSLSFPTAVSLIGTNIFSTGSSGAGITFASTIDGDADNTRGLSLNAGSVGNIALGAAVGATHPLANLTIANANNAAADAISSQALVQSAGSGTTTFNGAIEVTSIGGIQLTGKNFTVNNTVTTSNSASMIVANIGTLTLAGAATLSGGFTQNGAGSTSFSGASSITAGLPVSFAGNVNCLTGSTPSISTADASQSITFSNNVNGPGPLTLAAGGGNIAFAATSGDITPLGDLLIDSSSNISMLGLNAASLSAASSGTMTVTGTVTTGAGGVDLTVNNLTRSGGWTTTGGGSVTIDNSGVLTNTSVAAASISGNYAQTGTGPVHFAGSIATSGGTISYTSPVTLFGAGSYSTSGGDFVYSSTVDGGESLSINTGGGDITLSGAVGLSTSLGAISMVSNGTVQADSSITAASVQLNGTSTASFTGAVSVSGASGLSITAANITRGAGWNASLGGITLSIPSSGSFTSTAAGTIASAGPFVQNGTGAVSFGGALNTTNALITFNGAVTLMANSTFNSGGLAGTVTFANSVDGHFTLSVSAGTGNALFQSAVGSGTALGAITISSSTNTTFQSLSSDSLSVVSAIGTATLNGPTSTSASGGISIGASNAIFNGALATTGNGSVTVNNSGSFTLNANCSLAGTGAFSQIGSGASTISGSIATAAGAISFAGAASTLGTANISTSSHPILFSSTLDGPGNINFNAGSGGSIAILGAVGNSMRIGTLQITNANNVSMSSISAAAISQGEGAGTTAFTGTLNTNTVSGISLTGAAFTLSGSIITTLSGPVSISHSGLLTLNPGSSTLLSGSFTEIGAGTVNLAGTLNTQGSNISFANPITLTAPAAIGATSGSSNITLSDTVDGNTNFVLNGGVGGTISILGTVGALAPPNSMTITQASGLMIQAPVTVLSFVQTSGTGSTQIDAQLTATGVGGIVLTGTQFSFSAPIVLTGSKAPLSITNSALLSFQAGAPITADGPVSQLGTGSVSLADDITTVNNPVLFTAPVSIDGNVSITTPTSGGAITFLNTVTGANTLTLTAQGAVLFSSAINDLLSLQTISAGSFTAVSIAAGAVGIAGVTGVGTFNGPLNVSGPISLSGFGFALNNTVATTNSGSLTLTNSGTATVSSSDVISLDGAFLQNSTGPVLIGGVMTTDNSPITFQGPITLTGNLTLNSGAGTGAIELQNDVEGSDSLSLLGGLGNVTCLAPLSLSTPLQNLTVNGHEISLNGIGSASLGIQGALNLTATDSMTLSNFNYNAASQNYTAVNNVNFTAGGLVTITSHGPVSFPTGIVQLSTGSDLSVNTNNGALSFAALIGGSPEDVTLNLGSGTATLGTIGGDINTVIVNAGQIYFGGAITAASTTFTSLGSIQNLTTPVAIASTNTATFNAIGGDVGTLTNPILINTLNEIFAGTVFGGLADFNGSSVDNTIHPIPSNPPCIIIFNGIEIANCHFVPPPPPPPPAPLFVTNLFAVLGVYDSQFTLANDYYFQTYLLNERYIKKPLPIFSRLIKK